MKVLQNIIGTAAILVAIFLLVSEDADRAVLKWVVVHATSVLRP